MLLGQGSDSNKVVLFKKSKVGLGSGVDLVRWMQPGGDLQDTWIMFDHIKRVKKLTSMACHVYDFTYYQVITIAIGTCSQKMQLPKVSSGRV